MTKPVKQMTTQEKIWAATGYAQNAEKSLLKGNEAGAKQTMSRAISYLRSAMDDLYKK